MSKCRLGHILARFGKLVRTADVPRQRAATNSKDRLSSGRILCHASGSERPILVGQLASAPHAISASANADPRINGAFTHRHVDRGAGWKMDLHQSRPAEDAGLL